MAIISIKKQNWIAIVKISRPKVNAMNSQFFQELQNAFNEIALDENVRAVALFSGLPKVLTN